MKNKKHFLYEFYYRVIGNKNYTLPQTQKLLLDLENTFLFPEKGDIYNTEDMLTWQMDIVMLGWEDFEAMTYGKPLYYMRLKHGLTQHLSNQYTAIFEETMEVF